ncbi:MAG TPA: hypothetical protein ENK83_08830 [Aliiroseovarius sp.]|nr:hypothetical protein [Aliiroseovarius sp.]
MLLPNRLWTILVVSLTTTLAPPASARTCLPPDALIAGKPATLAIDEALICGRLEAMYLAGLGKLTRNLDQFQDNFSAEYRYYVLTRMFLMLDLYPNMTTNEARNAYLLSALAVLPESGDRSQIYASYILRTYFRRNEPALDLARGPMSAVILTFAPPPAITNEKELNCFVRADYPTFPVEKIMGTPVYKACVEAPDAQE